MRDRLAHWLVVLLLLGQLAGLAIQVPDEAWRGSLLEQATLRAVGPVLHGVATVTATIAGVGSSVRTVSSLERENAALKVRVELLEQRLLKLQGVAGEAERLARAVGYESPAGGPLRVADVVYVDHVSWLRTLVLWVDGHAAIRDQAVVVPEGLVGRVVTSAPPYAKVQLVTDRAAAVGAMIERTRRQGIVRGSGDGGLELAFLPKQAPVAVGDRVVTSGVDGVYPRGIPIGVVRTVGPGDGLFHDIEIAPAVDFGTLDHVYLLAPLATPPTPPPAEFATPAPDGSH